MEDKELERRLGRFDFSRLSPVRAPLLHQLISLRRSREMAAQGSEGLWAQRLNDEEMDMAAVAGNPAMMENLKDKQ